MVNNYIWYAFLNSLIVALTMLVFKVDYLTVFKVSSVSFSLMFFRMYLEFSLMLT